MANFYSAQKMTLGDLIRGAGSSNEANATVFDSRFATAVCVDA